MLNETRIFEIKEKIGILEACIKGNPVFPILSIQKLNV